MAKKKPAKKKPTKKKSARTKAFEKSVARAKRALNGPRKKAAKKKAVKAQPKVQPKTLEDTLKDKIVALLDTVDYLPTSDRVTLLDDLHDIISIRSSDAQTDLETEEAYAREEEEYDYDQYDEEDEEDDEEDIHEDGDHNGI